MCTRVLLVVLTRDVSRYRLFLTCSSRYGVDEADLLCYFHYLPQFYHLHLHVTHQHVKHDRGVERAHLIDDVVRFVFARLRERLRVRFVVDWMFD